MSSFDGDVPDGIDRSIYVNGDQVLVVEHADTVAQQVAYGATCQEHGDLMGGDWHDMDTAKKAVQEHLDVLHYMYVVEAVNVIRFLARTWMEPTASDPKEIAAAEDLADAAFAALDRFNLPEVVEWLDAQGEDCPLNQIVYVDTKTNEVLSP